MPEKERDWVEPAGHSFTVAEPLAKPLQGKSEPSGASGELFGALKGTGFAMIMWALERGAMAARAAVARRVVFLVGMLG